MSEIEFGFTMRRTCAGWIGSWRPKEVEDEDHYKRWEEKAPASTSRSHISLGLDRRGQAQDDLPFEIMFLRYKHILPHVHDYANTVNAFPLYPSGRTYTE